MSKNPFLNALGASLYIVLVSTVMTVGTRNLPKGDGFITPIAVMCLFTLSAAVMGYLFCFTPVIMYFDGKKKAAITFFLQTVVAFGVLTAVALALLFTGVGR